MTYNLFGNDGIHALAGGKSWADSASLVRCTFNIKYKENECANFSLQCKTHIHGFPEPQPFTLIYNADNLLPTTTTHTTPVRTLGQPDTDYIKRNSSPVTRALFLYLKDPCTFLCPDIPGSITHKPSHESAFTQLVGLLKETEIEILFDWNYLHKDQHHPFSTIVSQPEQLRGFPIDEKNLRGRKLGNWTIFSPTEPFVPTDPPPYADARQKRSRDVSTTPPFAPSPKRVFYIPQGSPTEKATTITSPSPTVDESLRAPSPHVLLEHTVRNMMQNIFPDILAQFLENSRSVSTSPPPSETKSSETPIETRPLYPALRALLGGGLAAKYEQRIATVCENVLHQAHYLRGAADEDFIDGFEEKKFNMQVIIEDMLERVPDDMDNLAKDKLEELEVTATAYVEEALEQMDKRLKQMESAMNKRLDTFLSNFRKRAPYGEPHTAEASYQKPNRYGCTAGHRRRHKHRGRIRQQ